VLEHLLQDFQTPLRFFWFNIYNLKRCLFIYRMRGKVSKVSYGVNSLMQIEWNCFSGIRLVQ